MTVDGHPPMVIRLAYDDKGRLASVARGLTEDSIRSTIKLGYDANLVTTLDTERGHFTLRYTCAPGKK